jgi:lysyl-tRNA synthetase class 1
MASSHNSQTVKANIHQADHWVDQVIDDVVAWQKKHDIQKLHVDDMKTPSGRVHTGSLEGVVYHDFFAKALQEKTSQEVVSTYVFNDMDSMDGLPSYLDPKEYQQHMGKPLYKIPAPSLDECGIDFTNATQEEIADFKSAKNFAEFYAYDFVHAFRKVGCAQEIVWSHEVYESGKMDETIRLALDNVDELKKIYRDIADYELPEKWYPFNVFCPNCGVSGSTLVTGWDGEEVTFECQPNKVEWATGCGHTGKISPFGGNGKLLWKVDWPSHWKVLGITVEGAGKDHTSAGGSRDMANAICERVLNIEVPFDIPYEWILIRGAKMSSSKGVGTSAREFTELFPAAVGRFLFANKHYNQVLDFDPSADAIPDLFDLYDQGARIYWEQEDGDLRLGRSFELSHNGNQPTPIFLPRFRDVAKWMQHPELNLVEEFEKIKGSALTEEELAFLEERKSYAQIWIDRYAPEEYQLTPTNELPAAATKLSAEQITFLDEVHQLIESKTWEPQDLQQAIFDAAKASIGARQGFQAIYIAYLGKTAGPRAAWMLLAMDTSFRDQRMARIHQASEQKESVEYQFEELTDTSLLSFDASFAEKYPTAVVGVAVIKGITIQKSNPELEAEKTALLEELQGLTTEKLNEYPEIQSYRQMYKDMHVKYQSRRPSPEALLRRIAQGKDLYTVNTCVDAYNLAVMRNRVSVGAFDLNTVQFPTQLKIAEGGEQIHLLGDDEPKEIKAGEVCYFDQDGPYNLDYNYRDAQRTMVRNETTDLLINVDGVYDITREQVEKTLAETIELITKYCGGTVETTGIIEVNKD